MLKRLAIIGIVATAVVGCLAHQPSAKPAIAATSAQTKPLRLMYWNIQNGMWAEQGSNYDKFVDYVRRKDPDVCVWCEAKTLYQDSTAEKCDRNNSYLPAHWGEVAARYGHKYWKLGGYRDNYPQVITSKYPIRNMADIIGQEPDSVVSHGAGWNQIDVNGKTLNIVMLHTWPQQFDFKVLRADPETKNESARNLDGHRYRRMELEYICNHTIGQSKHPEQEYWMMMGDFNSKSSIDNYAYQWPVDTAAFLCQDYIRDHTPYIDLIAAKYPKQFKSSVYGSQRIDYVYLTDPLYRSVVWADIVRDDYTEPVRDPSRRTNFDYPSDHCPVIVDFLIDNTR